MRRQACSHLSVQSVSLSTGMPRRSARRQAAAVGGPDVRLSRRPCPPAPQVHFPDCRCPDCHPAARRRAHTSQRVQTFIVLCCRGQTSHSSRSDSASLSAVPPHRRRRPPRRRPVVGVRRLNFAKLQCRVQPPRRDCHLPTLVGGPRRPSPTGRKRTDGSIGIGVFFSACQCGAAAARRAPCAAPRHPACSVSGCPAAFKAPAEYNAFCTLAKAS